MSITIPTSFSNPIALVIPQNQASIGQDDTDVSIYYADILETAPVKVSDLKSVLSKVDGSMHVRGQATAAMPKQQFAVKLSHRPKTGNFLGMGHGGKHWIFNDCGAFDFTLMRNIFAFSQQQSMGQYAPAYRFFELFILPQGTDLSTTTIDDALLSSSYHGLYLNFDKIRFQKSRINLPYDKHNITSEYAIIQLNESHSKYLQLLPNPPLTANVEVYEPEKKDIPANVQTEFLNWYFVQSDQGWVGPFADAFATHLAPKPPTPIPSSTFTTIQKTTDYESFAIYFVLNEIAKDPDGYHKSTYMVKNGSRVSAGPLWDKNKSYGNVASCGGYKQGYVKPQGWVYSLDGQSPVWWFVLIKDPVFCAEVWKQWTKVFASSSGMVTFIDNQVDYIKNTGALSRDCAKWPNAFNTPPSNYDIQVSELKDYLSKRLTWMDENLAAELKAQSGFVPPQS